MQFHGSISLSEHIKLQKLYCATQFHEFACAFFVTYPGQFILQSPEALH